LYESNTINRAKGRAIDRNHRIGIYIMIERK
jgi:hypothetical protein